MNAKKFLKDKIKKEKMKTYLMRAPESLLFKVTKHADQNKVSINRVINIALEYYLREIKK